MSSEPKPLLLTDDHLQASLSAADAVEWMREAVLAVEGGRLHAPARSNTDLGDGRLVFTTGAMPGEWFGYRSYDTFDVDPGEQVTVLHSARTGRVQAIAIGNALGRLRTGALGGLAVDVLARADAGSLGVIGSGHQAWTQVWAIAAVRPIERVRVFSRTPAHAERFATRVRRELGIDCETVGSAEAATREQDVVLVATSSRSPVIDAEWLSAGTHVTTLGPKQREASEFGLDLVEAASVVVTDSLAQLHSYDPPSIVTTSRHAERVKSLGAVVAQPSTGRRDDSEITLYLSVGLAGTEVHLLRRVTEQGTTDRD